MLLSVIIVNYNVKYYLGQCLHSLTKALQGIESEVIVVDNHSDDGSIEYLKPIFPHVRFVHCGHNMGFSRANNIGIRQSSGEYVLIVNPDTIVGEDVIADALNFMRTHVETGGLGVKMLKADGSNAMESRRGLPTPMTAFYKMSGLCARFPRHHRLAHYLTEIGLPHLVKFKSDLEVEITMYGKEFDFDNLSRGERTRLILSLSWSFRDVFESLNEKINLLFVDELLDNGLDASGVESALAVLKKMSREKRNIFLISHRDELVGRVATTMKVIKEGGFTSIAAPDTQV